MGRTGFLSHGLPIGLGFGLLPGLEAIGPGFFPGSEPMGFGLEPGLEATGLGFPFPTGMGLGGHIPPTIGGLLPGFGGLGLEPGAGFTIGLFLGL